jgi:hypothetical protein
MQLQIHQIQLPDPSSATLLFRVSHFHLPVMHICGDVAQHGAGVYRLTQLLPNILTNGLIHRENQGSSYSTEQRMVRVYFQNFVYTRHEWDLVVFDMKVFKVYCKKGRLTRTQVITTNITVHDYKFQTHSENVPGTGNYLLDVFV